MDQGGGDFEGSWIRELKQSSDNPDLVEYILRSKTNGFTVSILSWGATIKSIYVPDKNGQLDDVVLGFDDGKDYINKAHPHFGGICGRVANRIAKGRFTVDGKEYQLAVNNGPNHLHGGLVGFDKKYWTGEWLPNGVRMHMSSADGEEGYPGAVECQISYTVTHDMELHLSYTACTSAATPLNLTNHSYFNLSGKMENDVLSHSVAINADCYTPKNDANIPTGEISPVKNTLFELTGAATLKEIFTDEFDGYDHNFVLKSSDSPATQLAARVHHASSGRTMKVFTDQPGVQFYTANYLSDVVGKSTKKYVKYGGLCLETQNFPDSVNKPHFPRSILRPGQLYRHFTTYKFSVE